MHEQFRDIIDDNMPHPSRYTTHTAEQHTGFVPLQQSISDQKRQNSTWHSRSRRRPCERKYFSNR